MSIAFGKGDLLFEQRLLACGGFYTGKLDGLWGNQSRVAADAAVTAFNAMRDKFGGYDPRSEGNIASVLPFMQKRARQILQICASREKDIGLHGQVLSGTRTYAEQGTLFSQRPKVTNARGGQSNHNFGIAIDIGLFDTNGRYLTGQKKGDEKAYTDLAAIVKAAVKDIDWGGDWRSIKDNPHYEFHTGMTLSAVRKQFEAGKLSFS